MKKKHKDILIVLGFILFLNLSHSFFLFQKEYGTASINLEVTSSYKTTVWFSVLPKFKNNHYFTERIDLEKNITKVISLPLKENLGVKSIGLYWSRSDRGFFEVSKASLKSNQKKYEYERCKDFLSYSSSNLKTQAKDDIVIYTSQKKGNGWIMLNTERLERLSKTKKFVPLSWQTNLLLLLIIIALLKMGLLNNENILSLITPFADRIERLRFFLLAIWCFLLPFWNNVSHIMMGSLVLVGLIILRRKKEKISGQKLKPFIPLISLFFLITVIDAVFHTESLFEDILKYSYFIGMPFVFLGISNRNLLKIIKVFQYSVFLYCSLIVVAILERYYVYDVSISFSSFFFSIVEMYWHSSYLANLLAVALIFELYRNSITKHNLALAFFSVVFCYLSGARLPMLLILFLMKLFWILQQKNTNKRMYKFSIAAIFILVISSCIFFQQIIKFEPVKNLLYSKTEKRDVRLDLWNAGINLSRNNFFWGLGPENVVENLSNNLNYEDKIKFRNFNAHNQYLEFMLGYGFFVLLAFLFVLFLPIKKGVGLYPIFLIYFGIAMLVESYLVRQAGIIFFSFWYCFIIYFDRIHKESFKNLVIDKL